MSPFPDGLAPLRGVAIGILGALTWVVAGLIEESLQESGIGYVSLFDTLTTVGFILMIAGPAWYWFGRPGFLWVRRI